MSAVSALLLCDWHASINLPAQHAHRHAQIIKCRASERLQACLNAPSGARSLLEGMPLPQFASDDRVWQLGLHGHRK